MVNCEELMKKKMYHFYIFERANVVNRIKKNWSGTIFKNWTYFVSPVILFCINLLSIISDDVFYEIGKFGYINDFTNSIGLSILYFLSYFLSGYYPQKVKYCFQNAFTHDLNLKMEEYVLEKNTDIKNHANIVGLSLVLSGVLIGYLFFDFAGKNQEAFWITNISLRGKIVYCFLLGLTWYHSLNILAMFICVGNIFFWSLKHNKINYQECYFSKNDSIIAISEILLMNFAYGLFYIGVAILAIINDKYIATHIDENIKNALYYDENTVILLGAVFIIVIAAYIPLGELLYYMQNHKKKLLSDLDKKISKLKESEEKSMLIKRRNEFLCEPIIYTSWTSRLVLFFSVFIPAIGGIAQMISILKSS